MGRHTNVESGKAGFWQRFFRIVRNSILGLILLAVCVAIFFFSYLMGLEEWREFDPKKIGEMQQTLLIYDRNGIETAALYSQQNRVYVDIDDIPDHVKNAFIAVEDARFYEHNGVDFIRLIGAFFQSIRNGDIIRGTSSISQQLAKNTSLTGVRTISRKLQEAVMAFKLEQEYMKDEILEMYLNYIYFGNGAYGVEAAAKVYFGTNTASLSVAQAAQLAGVIKGPTHYAPHLNMENSIKRRNLVLSLMQEQGYISNSEETKAKAEPVVLSEKVQFEYGYFADMVLAEAEDILSVDSETLLSGGFRIYTTLDQSMQTTLEQLFEDPDNFPADASDGTQCEAAVCIIDSASSEIRAIVGGRRYETRRGLNRAINIQRQPGSAIKPVIVYAPAMEKLGLMPTSLVLDERGDFNGYIPKNFTDKYAGWVTLRRAVSSSLNLPAVRVFERLGVEAGKLYASNVGIPFNDRDIGLTLALGGFTTGVSPLRLGNAFTPFANGGYFSQPTCIRKIENGEGDVIYEWPETKFSVLSRETAFLMTSMLQSAATVGTARRVNVEGVPIAAKTGTSGSEGLEGNKDVWTVAYNPEYTMCCWMGFDLTDQTHCLPFNVTGGTYPARLLQRMFEITYSGRKAPDFVQPDSVVEAKIDTQSIHNNAQPLLAGAFTPEDQTTLEYFTQETIPTEYSEYWVVPSPPDDLEVEHGSGGYPSIRFTPKQSFVLYRVMREDVRLKKKEMIGEYSGAEAQILVNDFSASYGHVYRYYVVPVHPEIQIKGELLAGPQTAPVRITLLSEEHYMP